MKAVLVRDEDWPFVLLLRHPSCETLVLLSLGTNVNDNDIATVASGSPGGENLKESSSRQQDIF